MPLFPTLTSRSGPSIAYGAAMLCSLPVVAMYRGDREDFAACKEAQKQQQAEEKAAAAATTAAAKLAAKAEKDRKKAGKTQRDDCAEGIQAAKSASVAAPGLSLAHTHVAPVGVSPCWLPEPAA